MWQGERPKCWDGRQRFVQSRLSPFTSLSSSIHHPSIDDAGWTTTRIDSASHSPPETNYFMFAACELVPGALGVRPESHLSDTISAHHETNESRVPRTRFEREPRY